MAAGTERKCPRVLHTHALYEFVGLDATVRSDVTQLHDATKEDLPLWVSVDGCRLYFQRNYPNEQSSGVFVAARGAQ